MLIMTILQSALAHFLHRMTFVIAGQASLALLCHSTEKRPFLD